MSRKLHSLTLVAVMFVLVGVTPLLHAKSTMSLSIDLQHDLDIRRLRGKQLTKFEGRKELSKTTISSADFDALVAEAKEFLKIKGTKLKDPTMPKGAQGKSTVIISVNLNGKKKTVEFESDVEPGSVVNAPAAFKNIAEKLRNLAP